MKPPHMPKNLLGLLQVLGIALFMVFWASHLPYSNPACIGVSAVEGLRPACQNELSEPRRLKLADEAEVLLQYFESLSFNPSANNRQGAPVPRIYASNLPEDLNSLASAEDRKRVFLSVVLPLVLRENERLRVQRIRLHTVLSRWEVTGVLSEADSRWLEVMIQAYRLGPGDWAALTQRVDEVPPALAVAQAAIESGWGSSRFVAEGNALFGQWVWFDSKNGIVPMKRKANARHRVRRFATLYAAVTGYMRNLNTHHAYRDFRERRAGLRRSGEPLESIRLAQGLLRYSEKRQLYVRNLRNMIWNNKLHKLDTARLLPGHPMLVELVPSAPAQASTARDSHILGL